ncbi:UNVERIFIED_CONTAM: cellulose binding domain-containing protein [Acetivibrio alkalicellulosi]
MKKSIVVIILLFIIMSSATVFAQSNNTISNECLTVEFNMSEDISKNGRFRIMSSFMGGFVPLMQLDTSYTTIRIDGENYIFKGTPTFHNNISTTDYYIEEKNIHVRQVLEIVYNTFTKKNDTVEIKYIVSNTGNDSKSVGVRIALETSTFYGHYLRVPINTHSTGAMQESEFTGDNIPSYWINFGTILNPIKIIQGTFYSNSNQIKPDKIQFVSSNLYNYPWDYTIKNNLYAPRWIAMYWDTKEFEPGQNREYLTHYGLGDLQPEYEVPKHIAIAAQNEVEVDDIFTLTAFFDARIGGRNLVATLHLPEQLNSLSPTSVDLDNFTSEKMASWKIKVPPSAQAKEYTYRIEVTSDDHQEPEWVERKIMVLGGDLTEVSSQWHRSINSVHNGYIDDNKLNIEEIENNNYWTSWDNHYEKHSSFSGEKSLFYGSVDVPQNANNLVLTGQNGENIRLSGQLSVFVNGFKIGDFQALNRLNIDKKYLMPGRRNDILLILTNNTGASTLELSKIKVQSNLDSNHNEEKILDLNGFKIQYDESNLKNSKIVQYPENLILKNHSIDLGEMGFSSDGEIEYASFKGKINGDIYKYNGWHQIEKLFSSNENSNILFDYSYEYASVYLENINFEQMDTNFFDLTKTMENTFAEVYEDGSIYLSPLVEFDILGQIEPLYLHIWIEENTMSVGTNVNLNLDYLFRVSKKYSGYHKMSTVNLSGGYEVDLFTKEITNNTLGIETYDDEKIRLYIPDFGEISFKSATIDKNNIIAKDLEFNFSKDCIFKGLRPGNNPDFTLEFEELAFNRNVTNLSDLINSFDITITLNENIEFLGGAYLKAGSKFEGSVIDNDFFISFDGQFILPDDDETEVGVSFTINSYGYVEFSGSVILQDGLKIGDINLSPDEGVSIIRFAYLQSTYLEYEKVSPTRILFSFENVGASFEIEGAGEVKFNITQFAINENYGVDLIRATIKGDISFLNGNLIISTGNEGIIALTYDADEKFIFDAQNVFVRMPRVGQNGLEGITNLKMSTTKGLHSFSMTSDEIITLLEGLVTIEGLNLGVEKEGEVYSLTLIAKKATCDIKKAIPQLDIKFDINNLMLKVQDLSSSNPRMEIITEDITFRRSLNLNLGMNFRAQGIRLNLKNNTIDLLEPTITLPSIGGLEFYEDEACTTRLSNPTIGVSYLRTSYNGKWNMSVGTLNFNGACVYNLIQADICKVILTGLSLGKNNDKYELKIRKAHITVGSGYKSEIKNVTISNDSVNIGGGSFTIPELNIGGMGIKNFKAKIGTEVRSDGKKYPYLGGECSVIIPGLSAVNGYLTVQSHKDNFFGQIKEASFELTLGKTIPLGSTGLSIKTLRGSFTSGRLPRNFPQDFRFMFESGNNLKIVSMGMGLVDSTTGGKVLKSDADVWVELKNWGFALGTDSSFFEGFITGKADAAFANGIFAGKVKVRIAIVEGRVSFYVYKYEGKTSLSGEGSVSVKLKEGEIVNKKVRRLRIKVPKRDVWFDGIDVKFGRFTNGKVGFQGSVNFPVLGKMTAFFGDGGIKFFTNYKIYVPNMSNQAQTNTFVVAGTPVFPLDGMNYGNGIGSAYTSSGYPSSTPTFEDIFENGVYKGAKVTFSNSDDSFERIILIALADNGIPELVIKHNGVTIPLNDKNIEYEISEVSKEDDDDNDIDESGISVLLAIKNPGVGNFTIEARNEEEVSLSLITKLNEPELEIESVNENKEQKTVTVTGRITNHNNTENVNIIFRDAMINDDNDLSGERIVATSNQANINGVTQFTVINGEFSVEIDTSILRSGHYTLIAELERKVTYREGEELFKEEIYVIPDDTEEEEYEVYTREQYQDNQEVVVFEFINDEMREVTNLQAYMYSENTDNFSLVVDFDSVTKTADGYLMFADCFVDDQFVGTRKTNLGFLTEAKIDGYTKYLSVEEDGEEILKPVRMMIYIIPYKYIDPEKGFVYDFDTDLGFGNTVVNNIILGPESDKVEVWIEKFSNYIITNSIVEVPTGGFEIPVGETAKVEILVEASQSGKIIVDIESVSSTQKIIGDREFYFEDITVFLEENFTEVEAGTSVIDAILISNVDARYALENSIGEVKLRVSNANNPDDFKIVTVPYKFFVPQVAITDVYPEIINVMTGGIIDIYGAGMFKGTKVYLGTEELEVVEYESGINRTTVIVPEGFNKGQYDISVLSVAHENPVIWQNKINIVEPSYNWISIRDQGNVQRGTLGKFYFSLDSQTGYLGKVKLNTKNVPNGWSVQLNNSIVDMNEIVEVVITVPSNETVGYKEIVIEGNNYSDGSYIDIGKIGVTVTDTYVQPFISSISTNRAYSGEEVIIYGEGFNSQSSVEIVSSVGSSNMIIKTLDSNLIKAEVLATGTTGNLRINNSGTYSNSIPFTIIPDGIITNFEKQPIYMLLVPGESRTLTFSNSGYPMSTVGAMSILTTVDDETGKIKFYAPADTKPGIYEVFVNINYPNTVVQYKVVVYVVKGGNTTEDLARQVILEGRNLFIKVSEGNITQLQISKLNLNGNPLNIVPQKITDGWIIDLGMVNDKSVVEYQFDYTVFGNTYTTPIYEYLVEYENKYSDSDIYEVSLFEKGDGNVSLRVEPKQLFNPSNIVVTYKLNNDESITSNMEKVNDNWEVPLGKLPEGTYVSGSFVYGTGIEDITSQNFILLYQAKHTWNENIPIDLNRNANGDVIINIEALTFNIQGEEISPQDISLIAKFNDNEEVNTPMIKNETGYWADLGSISSGTIITPYLEFVENGVRYIVYLKEVIFYDESYENITNGIITEYFNSQHFTDKVLEIVEPQIDFDWEIDTPAGGLIEDLAYSIRWKGKIQPQFLEEYTFYVIVPNGSAKVWIDDVIIIDEGSQSGKINLTSAQMANIIVEYSTEGNGGIKLEWESGSQMREVVPKSRLFAVDVDKPVDDDDNDDGDDDNGDDDSNNEPNGKIRVQYTNEQNDIIANHIKPNFKVYNESTENIPFTDIKVRYWFTTQTEGQQGTILNWASNQQQFVVLNVVSPNPDSDDYYLEVSFTDTNEVLEPGQYVEIKAMIHKFDWSNYNQSNDYSFRQILFYQYEDSEKITAYTENDLAWGIEPQ